MKPSTKLPRELLPFLSSLSSTFFLKYLLWAFLLLCIYILSKIFLPSRVSSIFFNLALVAFYTSFCLYFFMRPGLKRLREKTSNRKKHKIYIVSWLIILMIVSCFNTSIDYDQIRLNENRFTHTLLLTLLVIFLGACAVFLVHPLYNFLVDIFDSYKYIMKKVFNVLSVLLFITFFFALLYSVIYLNNPNSFTPNDGNLSLFDFLYFSIVTITTLGYGDIQPVSPLAKSVCIIEVLVGVFVLLVYVSLVITSTFKKRIMRKARKVSKFNKDD